MSGSLAGDAREASSTGRLPWIPKHAKALWLKASLAHEQGKEDEALQLWKRLHAVLPPDSSDARLVENNIAEAERLAGMPVLHRWWLPRRRAANRQVAVVGHGCAGSALRNACEPGTPVFIYAKAVDAPGPPVAVMRTVTGTWPLRFTLDDSMAMMPDRKLSELRHGHRGSAHLGFRRCDCAKAATCMPPARR